MKKLFLFLMLITCVVSVKAYENEYFSIDIPGNYTIDENATIYKWTSDNKYIAVTINNNENKYDIEKYTDEDLKEQKKHLEETYKEQLKEYDVKVNVSDIERSSINDYSILVYDLFWESKDYTGYDMYQKGAVYTTKNYIYTITMSSDIELTKDDFNKLLTTFIPKDSKIGSIDNPVLTIIILGSILGVIGYIVSTKKNKRA